MKKSIVTRSHGVWKLDDAWLPVLNACRAREANRYAIEHIHVGENEFAVTNGRQLCALTIKHEVPAGLYWPTSDGYLLLDNDAGKFPDYKAILLPEQKLKKVNCGVPRDDLGIHWIYKINRNRGLALDATAFLAVWQPLMKIGIHELSLSHDGSETGPVQIECSIYVVEGVQCRVLYMQMPIDPHRWKD